MGRPRKPDSEKKLRGTLRKGRERSRSDCAVVSTGRPGAPTGLGMPAIKFWRSIVAHLEVTGIIGAVDGEQLAELCRRWEDREALRAVLRMLKPIDEPYIRLASALRAANKSFDQLAAKFGLTPADRARLRIEKPKASRVERPGAKYRE